MSGSEFRVGPLERLSPQDTAALLDCAEQRSFGVDEVILEQGQLNGSLFIVVDGLLHVRRTAEGRPVLLGRLESGSFFGDISLFDPGPTTASVVAVSEGRLIEISGAHLEKFTATHPAGAAQLLAGLLEQTAKRLRRTDDRLVEAIFWGGLLR